MRYYSTKNRSFSVSLKEAVFRGIADDGGLFMPERIPQLNPAFLQNLPSKSFSEIAFEAAGNFLADDIPASDIKLLVSDALNFDAPVTAINDEMFILELFHGPTLAFKDFGARFMSRLMSYLVKKENKGEKITILVATSGDTGSAVAQGFYKSDGIEVVLLYPSGKVSLIQEKQLTTLGENITALEVDGTFDDCQKLVKTAFLDKELTGRINLSSANSINIARLIPQSFYYINAVAQAQLIKGKDKPVYVSVPSGNFGNLTAGLIAKRMGAPIAKFIAAVNSNDVFLEYINTGNFNPRPSVKTLSNAMDVGNPSNFVRILDLYNNDHESISKDIYSAAFDDNDTCAGIKEVYEKYGYTIDPHGSVGYLALKQFISEIKVPDYTGIILETAHPAKFKEEVEFVTGREIPLPAALKICLEKEKQSTGMSINYKDFKSFLLTRGL